MSSRIRVGKDAKAAGDPHPKDARRPHPDVEKPTPAKKDGVRKEKSWGYSYEYHHWWSKDPNKWVRRYSWFVTEAGRDQAYEQAARKMQKYQWYRDFRKEKR